jgi:uncharacterized GH25 family protein
MKRSIALILLFAVIGVTATEFWIQPDKFIYKRGETVNLRFFTGDNFLGEPWNGTRGSVESLRFYFSNVSDTNLDRSVSDKKGDSVQLAMLDEGTAMVTMSTNNAFVETNAADFNHYLHEEGLSDALDYRTSNNDTASAGREYFQRDVKTIIQVGSKTDNLYKQRTSLPLDIIPGEHPYTIAKDGHFKIKVYFQGDALKNHKVRVWHRVGTKMTMTEHYTGNDGEFKFFITPEGEWMVSCVQMVRLANDDKADWQSYRATLTWGYTK